MEVASRSLSWSDLTSVLALQNNYDRHFFGEPLLTADDVAAAWRSPEFDLIRDSEGWFTTGGELAGVATLDHGGGLELAVAEGWAGSWLDAVLATRWEAEAARRGLTSVQRDLASGDVAGIAALESRGYQRQYTVSTFTLPSRTALHRRELPAGHRIDPFDEVDAPAAYAVIAEAFAEWGGEPASYQSWRASVLDRPDVRPDHCLLARCGGEVVGACMVFEPAAERRPDLWVAQLAVRPDHRRRGLARELLVASAVAARARGIDAVGLATDTRTGARGLYERLGMTVRHTLYGYALALGDGPCRTRRDDSRRRRSGR